MLGGLAAVTGLGVGGFALANGAESGGTEAMVAGSLQGVAEGVPGGVVEAHGSVAVRRLVVEGARDPDAVALADPALFDGLAEEVVLFATNALVLAYRPDSTYAEGFQRDWRRAVVDAGVGRTDPELDPLGYRTVMAVRLDDDLDEVVLDDMPVLPETSLMWTLEAGGLDAAFAYRSMAVEHGLPYVELPAAIDFSDPELADRYRSVAVDLGDGTVRGAPIRYAAAGLTDAGWSWVDDLVRGRERLREAGFGVPDGYPRRVAVDEF